MLAADRSAVSLPPLSSPQPLAGRRPITASARHVLMTTDAVGGVWRYSVDLGRALSARGVRATLAVMGPSPSADQRREAEHAGLALLDRPFKLEWMEDPWSDLQRAGDWLLALERTLDPHVVHLNGYAHAALAWTAPVVVVAHSCVRTWWRAVKGEAAPARLGAYGEAVTRGLAAARLVVAPTAAMLHALESEYGALDNSRVIPNGCITPPTEPAWHDKQDVILSAGRAWDDAKNIGTLCGVAGRVPWPVYVAGERREPGRGACALTAANALGVLDVHEMGQWFRRASIYALPAKYEPFGLSVLEAANAGCALVLGDIASLRENWTGAARFVPAGEGEALAAAISELAHDRSARRELGQRAFERAGAFTMVRTADAYVQAYEDVLE